MEGSSDSSGRSRGDRELFRKGGAELYLIGDGQESVVMQNGDFVMLLVKHATSPLAAVVAMVGDMQWPVGKDSLVVKGKGSRYSFSLPGGLTLTVAFNPPPGADADHALYLQRLDSILQHYSAFTQEQAGSDTDGVHDASEFWTKFARNAEQDSRGRTLPEQLVDPNYLPASGGGRFDSSSPKLAQKMQQARRMSAVAKIFSRSVETGAINPSVHVKGVAAEANHADMVVASVDAVAKVVEAVETSGRTFVKRSHHAITDLRHRVLEKEEGKRAAEAGIDVAAESLLSSAWTLNKLGLSMLFRTIASIHSKSNIRSSSHGRPSWTMDGSSRLRLSSSGSSSSVSSKLTSELPSRKAENVSLMQVDQPAMPRLSNMRPSLPAQDDPQAQARWLAPSSSGQASDAAMATQRLCRPIPVPPRFYGSAHHLQQATPADAAACAMTEPSVGRLRQPQPSMVQVARASQPHHLSGPASQYPRPHHDRPI